MPDLPISNAVILTRRISLDGPLKPLASMLGELRIPVAPVAGAEDAAARLLLGDKDLPVVFVELTGHGPAEVAELTARLAALRELVAWAAPVIVARSPALPSVMAAVRAGAVDVVDLDHDTSAAMLQVLERVARVHRERHAQRRSIAALRAMIEDFLRDLVKTERRSIDLEHKLARHERPSGPIETISELDEERPPTVFVVEDDRDVADRLVDELEGAGLVTFAFLSGEEALAQAERMANRSEAIDLALCDLRLPGIDGLETVRRLRARKPGLAAFLMTGYTDVEAATSAADLGVVGFVLKPFDDVPALVQRIQEQAQQAVARTREHHYLQRIKQRHERVLERYRKLAADLDR